jgi:hypothetical protein
MFTTPVLLLIYRRHALSLRVLDAIRRVKPIILYIASNAPNPEIPDDKSRVELTRSIISHVDWACDLKTKIYTDHMNVQDSISQSINWFFDNEESGIILEDDCIPDIQFFKFCQILLDKYKDNPRVWNICGTNYQDGVNRGLHSYYFSHYTHCWGWATWRRAWKHFDINTTLWPLIKDESYFKSILPDCNERRYWTRIFDNVHYFNKPLTWDYQWFFTCLVNGGLSVIPNSNLVSNKGFDNLGTNSSPGQKSGGQLLSVDTSYQLTSHPPFIARNNTADSYTFYKYYDNRPFKLAVNKLSNGLPYIRQILKGVRKTLSINRASS